MKKKTSEAQTRATEKWKEKNKEKQKKYVAKSGMRKYLAELIETKEEIEEVEGLLENARKRIFEKG
ncbi:MAG: hypothetical protein SOW18_03225 [Peptoniphilus sp.]|nr:hypothetical protein [Peptoniphilus sp.]MDY3118528.1 hypothetical protein [Peptoniphilus sp.]